MRIRYNVGVSWRRRIRRRTRRQLLVAGALIVVGVVFALIVSATGQRPFGAPSDEDPPKREDVVTPVRAPADEEAKEGQQRPEE